MNIFKFIEMEDKYIPDMLEIYNHYVENSTATFHKHLIDEQEMKELLLFNDPKYGSYVIYDKENICGYCILCQYRKREAFDIAAEVTIYLRPESQGRGAGSAAVDFIEKIANQRGIHVLLALITGENSASISLFEKKGYEKCAHLKEVGIKFGRLLDLVCFQKILPKR